MATDITGWDIKFNERALTGLQRMFAKSAIATNKDPLFKQGFEEWGSMYNVFIKDRYASMSLGGSGTGKRWKRLAPTTIKKKERKGYSSPTRRLWATQQMYDVIPREFRKTGGWTCYHIRGGIACGYTTQNRHPDSKQSYFNLARIHAQGNKRLPKRQILVRPDRPLKRKMAKSMTEVIKKAWNKHVASHKI